MPNSNNNNNKIAQNTLLLYLRMLITMGINLFSSRVILQVLGIEDFGIFNVVGGVIAMLGFITSSLGGASARYITYNLGIDDLNIIKKTFGTILSIHLILAFIIFLIGETLGLWFILTQLQIPEYRIDAAMWVYQCSIFSSILSILIVPYNATIIAHEKMSVFAYISITDAVLKLLIVYSLTFLSYDRLIVYAILFSCIQVFNLIAYIIYSRQHYIETHTKPIYDKKLFREIFIFASWTMNGNLAVIGFTQGLNMLLNIFFGPALNAARGVAVQVQSATQQLCTNFQMALNPQLTKSYAQGDLGRMHNLLIKSSKFSFYILFICLMPLMFEAKTVLELWLNIVPPHTDNFVRLMLIIGLLYTLSNPILVSVHSTGQLKKFQIVEGTILLSIVPIAYIFLKFFKVNPESVFFIHIIIEIIAQYARIRIVLPLIDMRINTYLKKIIIPISITTVLSPIIPFIIHNKISSDWSSFFLISIYCFTIVPLIIYKFGCTISERIFLRNKIITLINSKRFKNAN